MSDLPDGARPFDRDEIQPCAACGKGIGHAGGVEFYELTVGRVLVDFNSLRQITASEMMVGNALIGRILAPTSRIGARMPTTRFIICDKCAYDVDGPIMPLFPILEKLAETEEHDEGLADPEV